MSRWRYCVQCGGTYITNIYVASAEKIRVARNGTHAVVIHHLVPGRHPVPSQLFPVGGGGGSHIEYIVYTSAHIPTRAKPLKRIALRTLTIIRNLHFECINVQLCL
jgi:hypothetical protein